MQKICIIGGGLTGLTTALILSKLNVKVDLVAKLEPSNRINDNRTTAISPSNYKSLCNFLSLEDQKMFWPSTNIDLYHEQSDKYHHFMNFKNNGKNIIFDVDVVGGLNLKKYFGKKALSIFIDVPDISHLKKRLKKRGADSDNDIDERILKAKTEILKKNEFDIVVMNDKIDFSCKKIFNVVNNFLSE